MHPVRRQRLFIVLGVLLLVGVAVGLATWALRANINAFYTPADVVSGKAPVDRRIRVGGLVVVGSLKRQPDSLKVRFDLTDGSGTFAVDYDGILPDLFREGQGILATGRLGSGGNFEAEEVLAKHDEKYMPPEVKDALQKAGHLDPGHMSGSPAGGAGR